MRNKISIVLIFLMALLNLLPPMLSDTIYFDNSYYIILFLLLTFLGFSIPFLADNLNKNLKRLSTLIGGWFMSGLLVEIFNLTNPEIVFNTSNDKMMFFKFLFAFIIGVSVIISNDLWTASKQKK